MKNLYNKYQLQVNPVEPMTNKNHSDMSSHLFTRLVICLTLVGLCSGIAFGQISGPSSPSLGSTTTYTTVDDQGGSYSWWTDLGYAGGNYTIGGVYQKTNVYWTTSGTGTLIFYIDGVEAASKEISVGCGAKPPTPVTGFVLNTSCAPATVSYTGTPPSGVSWYWTSGIETDYGGSTSYQFNYSGTLYLRARNNSSGCWSSGYATFNASINPIPPQPSVPTVSANSCGPKTLTRGTPPGGITWYWQTSYTGTSTADANPTYTVNAPGGTYYLRARDNSTGCWSLTGTTGVPVIPYETPAPTSTPVTTTNTCGNQYLTVPGSPPSEITWYWQGTNAAGTSTAQPYTTAYTVTTGTNVVYHLRAYNYVRACWSNGTTSVSSSVALPPDTPTGTISISSNFCGPKSISFSNSPPVGQVWYWQGTNPSGTSTSGTSYTVANTTGTYYLRAYHTAKNCWSISSQAVAVTINAPPTPAITKTNYVCGNQFISKVGTPPGGVSWYWQGLNDTGVDDTSPVAKANVYIASYAGTYTYYLRAKDAQGCWSLPAGIAATVDPPATIYTFSLSGGGDYVSSPSGQTITLNNSQTGKKYQLSRNPIGTSNWIDWDVLKDGVNGSSLTWTNLPSGYYKITGSHPGNNCPVNMSGYVKITLTPVATASKAVIAYGESTTVTTTASYLSYQWIRNGVDIPGATTRTITVTSAGEYKVRVGEIAGETGPVSTPVSVVWTLDAKQAIGGPVQMGFNIESNTTVLVEGVKTLDAFYALYPHQFRQSLTYQDGLGRPYQNVLLGQSTTGNDIIEAMSYAATSEKSFLPYEGTSRDGRSRYKAISDGGYGNSEQYLFYMTKPKMAHDAIAYAETRLSDSPLGHVREQAAPGTNWAIGSGHTVKNDLALNTASQVRYWKPDGTTTTTYLANALSIQQVTDENGNKVRTFIDKMGRTVLKQVQLDETVQSILTPWLETYYVYDSYGNLTHQIPPKAMAILGTGPSLNANNASIAELIFKYTYDARGRLTEKKVPGAIPQFYVYDKYDRLILIQDGNLRSLSKWLFAKYDSKDRPVMMGLYTNTTQVTLATMQTFVDGQFAGIYFEDRGTTLHGYTNLSFPTTNSTATPLEVLSVNYFDDYDFDFNGTTDYSYTAQGLAGEGSQVNAYGLPTGGKRLVLGSATWLYSYVFYDTWNRPIQVRSNNHLSAAIDNLTTTVYDYVGRVLTTKTYHNAGATNQTTTLITNAYDFLGRLVRVHQSINGGAEVVLASYKYNELGQLLEKNLHCKDCGNPALDQPNVGSGGVVQRSAYSSSEATLLATQSITLSPGYTVPNGSTLSARIISAAAVIPGGGGTYMQSVDYRYNIRGWLASINNSKLDNDYNINAIEYTNDDDTDYFGLEMMFNTVDAGIGNTARHNGSISAIKWKGIGEAAGNAGARSFKYAYDKADRLKDATFAAVNNSNPLAPAWTKEVNTLNENITYDVNGNILSLQRKTPQRTVLSNFTPSATAQTMDNLVYTYPVANPNKLEKVEDTGTADGFKNGVNTATEYTYNSDGSVTRDDNKGINSIAYNELGKPSLVTFADGRTVQYTYDGAGMKLKMAVTVSAVTTTTDYVGGFVYKNNALDFFGSPEGRVVKNGSNLDVQYAIKDHQGNTRIVFATKAPTPNTYTATFEDNTLTSESTGFQNYPTGAWRSSVELFDHTDATTTYTRSQLLNGAAGGQVGLAKTLKVFPGDVINASVYAKYFNATSTTSNILGFATALTSAFGVTAGSTGDGLKAFTSLNNFGGVVAANNGSGSPTAPKAFITILLFDQNYNFVNLAYDQIDAAFAQSGATKSPFDLLTQTVTVREPGYAYIYISNENPTLVDVYFDDLSITHTKTPVIQYNEYYPFGLQTMNSWTRENNSNNFLYNEGTELNATTGMYDLQFRNYDPVLGRFVQVDPMADSYGSQTPYNYANNDPVTYNDPLGLLANTSDWMTFGGTTARRIDNNGHTDLIDRGYGMLDLASGEVASYGYSNRQSLTFYGGDNIDVNVTVKYVRQSVDGVAYSTDGPLLTKVPAYEPQFTRTITFGSNEGVLQASFLPTELGYANNLLNAGSTLVGAGELGLDWIRQFPNGSTDIARGVTNLIGSRVGTQATARFLTNTFNGAKSLGSKLGGLGAILSTGDYLLNGGDKNGYEHASYWIGMGVFALTVLNPATAAVGLVYGAAQLGSYLYNGKSAEENIGKALGY